MGNFGLLSNCMLGMECQWMGLQIWCSRLCWRRTRRDWFWSLRPRILHGAGKTTREDDAELPATQRLTHHPRHHSSMVWLVRIQRWLCFWCKPSCGYGLLELLLGCYVRCRYLVYSGLPTCKEMVHGRLVFRLYLWPRRCYASIWFHPTMGRCHPRCCNRHCC